ncbi:hypothetical protein KKH23_07155 [Patescibacteria group bacterium]|nr:hypothetical protein [Patescibacteria group bacterium]MBU0846954.1 hypothetical protein [Patescibacteria group bacterium]
MVNIVLKPLLHKVGLKYFLPDSEIEKIMLLELEFVREKIEASRDANYFPTISLVSFGKFAPKYSYRLQDNGKHNRKL